MEKRLAKVLAALLLMCSLLVTAGFAQSEEIDLSRFTDDELMALSDRIQSEFVTRGVTGTAELLAGKYTGGTDIPAGRYALICETDADHSGIVSVSAPDDDLEHNHPSVLFEFLDTDASKTFSIEIKDGSILNVPFPVKLQISAGVVFK